MVNWWRWANLENTFILKLTFRKMLPVPVNTKIYIAILNQIRIA